jgi:hypothetical protein
LLIDWIVELTRFEGFDRVGVVGRAPSELEAAFDSSASRAAAI